MNETSNEDEIEGWWHITKLTSNELKHKRVSQPREGSFFPPLLIEETNYLNGIEWCIEEPQQHVPHN